MGSNLQCMGSKVRRSVPAWVFLAPATAYIVLAIVLGRLW